MLRKWMIGLRRRGQIESNAENEIKPRFNKHKEGRMKGKEAERWLWDEEFADILLSRQRESPGIIPSKESTSCLCCTGRKSKFSSLSLQA